MFARRSSGGVIVKIFVLGGSTGSTRDQIVGILLEHRSCLRLFLLYKGEALDRRIIRILVTFFQMPPLCSETTIGALRKVTHDSRRGGSSIPNGTNTISTFFFVQSFYISPRMFQMLWHFIRLFGFIVDVFLNKLQIMFAEMSDIRVSLWHSVG